MLQQKQRIRLCARQNRALGLLLNFEPGRVFNTSKSFDFQSSLRHHYPSRDVNCTSMQLSVTTGGVQMNRIAVLAIACLLTLPAAALAQTRRRTTRGQVTPKQTSAQANAKARTDGATK